MRKLFVILAFCMLGESLVCADELLLDWSDWEKYRSTVKHPCTTIKQGDIGRARENIKRYDWAKRYARDVEQNARALIPKLTPEFLENIIPTTTPGSTLGTPCPACREAGKPPHTHGSWTWSLSKPDEIKCRFCGTVFPNQKYPEDIVLKTTWGKPQTLTFCGGDTFPLWSYKFGRPSFSGHIRARKAAWASSSCRSLAEAHALTGKPEYALACKAMLLRFADVYPNWLIHEGYGYGEVADMDPRIAAEHINKLPEPELCYPPNKPDFKLHTGYWSAGRAGACGMDGGFIRTLTEAYDLTCEADEGGKPVYSEEERKRIEKDVLLEGTVLFVCDKRVNNKSVGNSAAAALVGMCVGHPGLVRFGLDSFMKTVDEWYLPDGCTSESPSYGLMTLAGIVSSGQAFRGYSDPPGYRDAEGKRIENLDLYHDTSYEKVFEAFYNGLQGDLHYPPYADSSLTTRMSSKYAELMAANYPDRPKYLSLLKEIIGHDLAKGYASYAIYYREPGLEQQEAPPLALPDICFDDLRIGHLRTGVHGRESLLFLSASHDGIHHHYDSLNLYYWKEGREVLSDLGYLWDHPMKKMTYRTAAHNLVIIDEKEQSRKGRGGEFHLFDVTANAKVMEASSLAYPDAKMYRRTSAVIMHGEDSYVVDIFRVEGGKTQDYLFHGINNMYRVEGLALKAVTDSALATFYDLDRVKTAGGSGVWRVTWDVDEKTKFLAMNIGQPGESALIGDGWGQRDPGNRDFGAVIPYIVRRCTGAGQKRFISLFEGYESEQPLVQSARRIAVPDGAEDNTVALQVKTRVGTDYVVSSVKSLPVTIETPDGPIETDARFVVLSVHDGRITSCSITEGKTIKFKGQDGRSRLLKRPDQ